LLSSPCKQLVLHGDLHHDNILNDGNDWLTIDPKGIIGEAELCILIIHFHL
jgi:streptomycin 6-kinase